MSEHYFEPKPSSAHEARAFVYQDKNLTLRFETDSGVFSKSRVDKGTALLLKALPSSFTGRALDLGCGWGALGVWMAAMWSGAQVVMADINERAVHLSKTNIKQNGLTAEVIQSDGLDSVPGSFNLIALNPPIRAGKAAIFRLYEQSISSLREGGALYIVIQKKQGAESTLAFIRRLAADVSVAEKSGGYWVIRAVKHSTTLHKKCRGWVVD